MKALVICDTPHGNSSHVAEAIAVSLGDVTAIEVEKFGPEHLIDVGGRVVGSPTQGGRPTVSSEERLRALPALAVPAAALDPRLRAGWFPSTGIDLAGYAAPCMARALDKKGCAIIDEPQGFVVAGGGGPLAAGELERVSAWVATLRAQLGSPTELTATAYHASERF
jgi:hypothetical protein